MHISFRLCASISALAATFLSSAIPAEAAGRDERDFFNEDAFTQTADARRAKKQRAQAYLKNLRAMHMEQAALLRPRISLTLMGEEVMAVRDRIEQKDDGTLSWIGHIAGSPENLVVLTDRRGAFAGRVDYEGRAFEISRKPGGALMIGEIDAAALPEEEPYALPDAVDDFGPVAYQQKPATANAEVRQDIFIAYTDDACRDAGGDGASDCAQVEAKIANAVADMNAAYNASRVNITVNLVGMALTDYDEGSKSISDMLGELRRTSDGQMDELHTARDNAGADLLALVTGSGGGYCGIAYVDASASYAMSVTAQSCLSSRTLAHEVGHNQGSSHARSQNGGGTSGAYNYGYRRCNDGSVDDVGAPYFSTIMAYGCRGAARTGSFSNPNVNVNGVPSGIDPNTDPGNAAWAARTLNESAARIAGFRAAATTPPPTNPPPTNPPPTTPSKPAAPDNLVARLADDTTIALSWRDNADNEDRFRLQRAQGSGGFRTIATLPANRTSYSDSGRSRGETYRYRVRASNSDGASSYSAIAEATTPSPPTRTADLALRDFRLKNGTIRGTFRDTHKDDGVTQQLREVSRGRPSKKRYRANHLWEFDILGGGEVTFSANAYVSGDEGFHFLYKRLGDKRWRKMFTVNENNRSNVERFTFPAGTSGRVLIRAKDAYRGKHESPDTLYVDHMEAVSNPSADQAIEKPPAPVIPLTVSSVGRRIPKRSNRPIYLERLRE